MTLEFTKYQGLGNDFILIDNRQNPEPMITPSQAEQLCDRNFGIGADGVIFALPPTEPDTDYTMRIYNSDASEPEMCGNGIRCLARFLVDLGVSPRSSATGTGEYRIQTLAGVMTLTLKSDGQVTVDMGLPRLLSSEIPTTLCPPEEKAVNVPLSVAGKTWDVTCVSMGNPHCITFVEDVEAVELAGVGPQFENHPAFPKRTNTEFIQVMGRSHLKMRVWERGAGATLACGTGACATLVAGVLTGRCDRQATIELPGGPLNIEWSESDGRLYMTGPAERVFSGRI